MEGTLARHRIRAFALAVAIGLIGTTAAVPAEARVSPGPVVDIQSAAWLAPDGSSVTVQLLASCPERWTVVEAVVAVSQPQASGQASFPLTCIGSLRMFSVAVRSTGGTFELGRGAGECVRDHQARADGARAGLAARPSAAGRLRRPREHGEARKRRRSRPDRRHRRVPGGRDRPSVVRERFAGSDVVGERDVRADLRRAAAHVHRPSVGVARRVTGGERPVPHLRQRRAWRYRLLRGGRCRS
jgi:hypothetical protein